MDGLRIEREAKIPDEYIRAMSGIGVFGMKIPTQYGGLGLSMYYYGRALMLIGSVHPSMGALVSAHSRSACRSRSRCSATSGRSRSSFRGAPPAASRRSC
jgi:alkylation response protein AidB-like acyl-CoA dehydrogenase